MLQNKTRGSKYKKLTVMWSVSILILTVYSLTDFSIPQLFFPSWLMWDAAVSSAYSQQIGSVWPVQSDMSNQAAAAWCFQEIQMTDTSTCSTSTLERSIDDAKSRGSCRLAPAQRDSTVLAGSPIGLIFPLKVNHCAPPASQVSVKN